MRVVVMDTETSGLIFNRTLKLDKQPSIIEFYACDVNLKTGKKTAEFHTFIKPPHPLPDKPAFGDKKTITDITGITNEMLADKAPFAAHADQIIKFLSRQPIVIAHNAAFDREMVDIELERLEKKMKWKQLICTVEQTIAMKGFRLSLTALHEELFGEPFKDAHRADVDTQALVRCCCELYKRGVL